MFADVDPGGGVRRVIGVGGDDSAAAEAEARGVRRAVRPVPNIQPGPVKNQRDFRIGGIQPAWVAK